MNAIKTSDIKAISRQPNREIAVGLTTTDPKVIATATSHLPGAVRPAKPTRRAFIGAASLAMPLAAMETVLLGDRPQPPRVVYFRPIEEMTVGQLRDLKAPSNKHAQYEADIADWQARHDELDRHTIGDLEDWYHAVFYKADASNAILLHPAPDREALLFKLDLAERVFEGCDLDTKVTGRIFSDVLRFARGEA